MSNEQKASEYMKTAAFVSVKLAENHTKSVNKHERLIVGC